MNFLKKKLKPIAANITSSSANNSQFQRNKNKNSKPGNDLEDDLYDDYLVEAPPHPSELLALGVDPAEIDANDPEKLRELYLKAKSDSKISNVNSVLLARERQKLEIEEKKKTREEWKFFDSITSRVEQVVKQSQQTLDQLKESSAVDHLQEPEFELRLSADEVFKASSSSHNLKKDQNGWINFDSIEERQKKDLENKDSGEIQPDSMSETLPQNNKNIVDELLEDFGLDLRSPEERKRDKISKQLQEKQQEKQKEIQTSKQVQEVTNIDLKKAVRPRPRPQNQKIEDPFDTSYVQAPLEEEFNSDKLNKFNQLTEENFSSKDTEQDLKQVEKVIDPFDTSFVLL